MICKFKGEDECQHSPKGGILEGRDI